MKSYLVFAALLLTLTVSFAQESPKHLPPETPVTATVFVCDFPGKLPRLLAMIVTFKSGLVIRLDGDNTYGMSGPEIVQYGATAADKEMYRAQCMPAGITT